jgi:hypothetical protein
MAKTAHCKICHWVQNLKTIFADETNLDALWHTFGIERSHGVSVWSDFAFPKKAIHICPPARDTDFLSITASGGEPRPMIISLSLTLSSSII